MIFVSRSTLVVSLMIILSTASFQDALAFSFDGTGSSRTSCNSRRNFMQKAASVVAGGALALNVAGGFASPAVAKEEKATAVLRSAGCARGAGEACEELAEGNEFILSLQRKSQESAAQADADALAAYNNKNFPDFMASLNPPKYLVKQPNGKFAVYDGQELATLKSQGKIKVEKPMAKGGKIGYDLTQKPILVQID